MWGDEGRKLMNVDWQEINDNNLSLEQLYNIGTTCLYFKLLPQKTLVAPTEKSATWFKVGTERFTVAFYLNASSTPINHHLLSSQNQQNQDHYKNWRNNYVKAISEHSSIH